MINSRLRNVARAIWMALLERPVASASVRKLATTGFHFFRAAWP
jgi:hypothetical protein